MKVTTETRYLKALAAIKRVMAVGLVRAEKEFTYRKLLTYWQIGRIIHRDILRGGKLVERRSKFYLRFENDLGIDNRTLRQTVQVFRAFPDRPKKDGLNWNNYALLVRVSDRRKRLSLKKRILAEHLTDPDLRRIIKEINQPKDFIVNRGRLKIQRGKLYHYRVLTPKAMGGRSSGVEIDCGFDIVIDKPEGVMDSSQGKIVHSLKEEGGYRTVQLTPQPPRDILYTYQAVVERVVDADTLLVKIDVGFGVHIRQRLRLRGIDAPELGTAAGREAKAYVEGILKECPSLVIKTYGSDKYDRYLVDVFILPGVPDPHEVAAKGELLNQQLLDEGHASIWEG